MPRSSTVPTPINPTPDPSVGDYLVSALRVANAAAAARDLARRTGLTHAQVNAELLLSMSTMVVSKP
jgi:hypothetical protein